MSQMEELNYPEWTSKEAIPAHWLQVEDYGFAMDVGRCLSLKKLGERIWYLDLRSRIMSKIHSHWPEEMYPSPMDRYSGLIAQYEEFAEGEMLNVSMKHPTKLGSEINRLVLETEVEVGRHPWEEASKNGGEVQFKERPKITWKKNLNTLAFFIHVLEENGYLANPDGGKEVNALIPECFIQKNGEAIGNESFTSLKNQMKQKGGNAEWDEIRDILVKELERIAEDLRKETITKTRG